MATASLIPSYSPGDFERLQGEEALEKVRELLKHFRASMLVTVAPNGSLHARPMGLVGKAEDFAGTFWFFTARGSAKLREIEGGSPVSLIFQADGDAAYLHLEGRAREVEDRAKMEQLYTPLIKVWFPEGLDDPELTLLRVDVDAGNFWENPGGKLRLLAAFTESLLTGKQADVGHSGELQL